MDLVVRFSDILACYGLILFNGINYIIHYYEEKD